MATNVETNPPKGIKAFRKPIILLIGMFVMTGFAYWWGAYKTYHFLEVQPGVLYRDGNQGAREFVTAIKRSSSKTVVPLIDDAELADPEKSQFKKEMDSAGRWQVNIERVPVKLGGWPTTEDVRAFLKIAEDKSKQPVLVHCAQGVRRTGMMVAAYQMSVLGYDKAKANAAIETFGHSERSIGDVRKFIEVYDPATRTVTKELDPSKE